VIAHGGEDAVDGCEFFQHREHRRDHGGIGIDEIARQGDKVGFLPIERFHGGLQQWSIMPGPEVDVRHQADSQTVERGW
jgi:hypothetical protein